MQQSTTRKSDTASGSVTLEYFISRLAEEITLNENSCSCDMCAIGSCGSQVSGMTCLNGITTWLKKQAEVINKDATEREKAYFTYLDSLLPSQLQEAVLLLEERFPHLKRSVSGAHALLSEWLARKGRYLI